MGSPPAPLSRPCSDYWRTLVKRRLIPVVLIVLAGIFAAWKFGFANNHDPNVLKLSGNIELTEVDLSFKGAGRLAELLVDEGDFVKKGQVIARLDSRETEQSLARERAGVDSASSALTQLRTAIDYQRASIAGDLALRRAEVDQAAARLRELEAGSRPQELEQSRAAFAEAEVQFKLADADWQRAQALYKNEDISTAQYDQFRTKYQAAGATLKRAKESLALVQEGPRREQIDQARAALQRTKAALQLSEASQIDLKRREQEVAMREAEIERARAQAGVLEVQLNDRVLVAPVDGIVLTKSAELGEVIAAGTTILTLGDIARPWARAYIAEQDLGRVKIGMNAELSTDSYPGKTYTGRISFISSEAEFTPKQIQTQEERVKLVYRIKVETPNPQQELKSNMPVDVTIRVQP